MSITFAPEGRDEPSLNVSLTNASDLLSWLGYSHDVVSDPPAALDAHDLVERCLRRLWPDAANEDPGRAAVYDSQPGQHTFIDCGRRPGYLRMRTEQLLAIAEVALEVGAVVLY